MCNCKKYLYKYQTFSFHRLANHLHGDRSYFMAIIENSLLPKRNFLTNNFLRLRCIFYSSAVTKERQLLFLNNISVILFLILLFFLLQLFYYFTEFGVFKNFGDRHRKRKITTVFNIKQ